MRDRTPWRLAGTSRSKLSTSLALCGTAALGFWLGRGAPQPAAVAAPPAPPQQPAAPPSDYSQRVVAYVYNTVPITREDLGEYLIARQGSDKVELLVNKRIIEVACQKKGIDVTAAEVEAALEQDLQGVHVNRADFVAKVLKQMGKSLYEWKEDVLKPRLQLTKLCKERITLTDDDLRKAFDAQYGPRVECRIIIWPKGEEKVAFQVFEKIRNSEDEFAKAASGQAISALAATGGKIKPIGHDAAVHAEIEAEAFRLQPGQVSRLISTPEGTAVLKCDKLVPADATKQFEAEKDGLRKVVYDKKVEQEIPKYFKKLHDEANPTIILKHNQTASELERDVQKEIKTGAAARPGAAPTGN
jgi:hypothetical protein